MTINQCISVGFANVFDGLTAINEGGADLGSSENVVAGIGMFDCKVYLFKSVQSRMDEFALIYILKEGTTFLLILHL